MKHSIILVLLFLSFGSFAQGEANIWYFGEYAGLDFNSGTPVALTDGQMVTHEGCASISNAAGQVLFYTDGVSIWNKNHQIMPNGTGLLGNSSSTQSAIIVPKPNSSSIYYVFTVDAFAWGGLNYSEVDMTLDGGLGDINSNKNLPLVTPTCEKITAIKNASGDGYWVVTHGFSNNSYFAYSITSAGVNTTAVISNVGDMFIYDYTGYLKISPDGSKLINCSSWSNTELFNFDSSSGIVSNPVQILLAPTENCYGAEFSPSGNILYLAGNYYIYQYDLTASNIRNSKVVIYNEPLSNSVLAALQLGSNGKIYGTVMYQHFLCAINNPDVLGPGCNFQLNAVSLGTGISRIGLPQFNQSYFNVGITVLDNCLGEATSFSINGNQTILSATWNFGDGTPASNSINPIHSYSSIGTYTVSVTATSTSGTSTKTRDIVISDVPTATQPQNMLICDTNNDGLYNFDLTSQSPAILNGQNPSLYIINYYANASDYASKTAITTPGNYVNTGAYQQQTIIAEVSNNANGNCKSSTTFTIDVFDMPLPNSSANIPNLTSCDNTSVGSDTDGRIRFDLTQRATVILNGQSAANFSISYYTDSALTDSIATPATYQNTNPTETIYVKVANIDNPACFALTSFTIQVLSLPVITNAVNLKQCDDNIDGFSVFNLIQANNEISTNAVNETFAFFETAIDAENNNNPITNVTTYTNQTVSTDVVYVRVTNFNGCHRVAQLNLIVSTTQIPLSFAQQNFTQCDDAISGTNTDGIASFDFSSVTTQIQNIFPAGQQLDITYYRNLADALAENNAIMNISNYRNIGYPTTQNIYIRVDSQLNNDCLGLGSHITLHVEPIPIVSPIVRIHCDDNQDGLYPFNTSTIQTTLVNGLTNVTVAYFDQNNMPLPSPLPNPFLTASQTLRVVVSNTTATACNYETTIQFIVDDLPQAFPIATSLTTVCDDEPDPVVQDGLFAFNTSTFESTILGAQTGMTVSYFDGNNNPLPSPLPNPYITATQNVKVEVINPSNTMCKATLTIPFVVLPVPIISLSGDEVVCSNNPNFTKVIDAGLLNTSAINTFTYKWYLNGSVIPSAINYSLTINTQGVYSVEVTNAQGCSRMRTITVVSSNVAAITNINIVDLSESNSITVYVSGSGDYVYSLDDEFGFYQVENIFTNVGAGIHTVFVKDLNGCGVIPKDLAVLGIPNYFTPNGDGFNDFWNIKGANARFNEKTIIYIFDRYGKLLKQISPISQGWNGMYNDAPMPSSDYWYSILLEDGRNVKGHFTLKR